MHTVSNGPEWHEREEVGDQREKRVAGGVLDPEEIARQDEKPVVLQGYAARRGQRVKREQHGRDAAGLHPVGPGRPEAPGRQRHQRLSAVEPPQVNDAVVKKFQSAAISAPASPAAQYTIDCRYSHSATAILMNAPMPQAI